VEQLSSELNQLKLQRKIDKLKKKFKDYRSRQLTSLYSLNEETDASFEEEVKRAREEEREIRDPITLLPLTIITCLPLAPSLGYPLVKPPISIGWVIPNRDT
jgi:hypothetical protein